MIPIIYPYKMGSKSATALARALTTRKVFPDGRYRQRPNHLVINWGNSNNPNWDIRYRHLNHPVSVLRASNKLYSFRAFSDSNIQTPEWTTSSHEAGGWISDGIVVLAKTSLTGHSGAGIIVLDSSTDEMDLPDCQLFVKYKKKRYEYRVHVFKGEVIDTQQKRKSREANQSGDVNTLIRSHSNGWVFCRDGITPDPVRESLAIRSVEALGLDFGAVDIIYNERENQYYTLEVNTAPGLEGTTLDKYVEAIQRVLY
jgi:hypothetical protein